MIPQIPIELAIQQARRSEHKNKHGAVIFKGKRIYSFGYNQPSRSVKSINRIAKRWHTSVHAEVAAILNAKRDLNGLDILIVRINNKDQFRYSRPCNHCLQYIQYCGLRKIYYSIDRYPYIEEL